MSLNQSGSTSNASVQVAPSSAPKITQTQDFDFEISPHETTTGQSYVYVTPAGNYSFSISNPLQASYVSLWGNTTEFSGYAVEESGSILTPGTSVTDITQTGFSVNTTQLSGPSVEGYLYCSYDFVQTPEETTCNYREVSSNDFNIVGLVTGNYLTTDGVNAYSAESQSGLVSLGNASHVTFGATPNPADWHDVLDFVWSGSVSAILYYGQFSFASSSYYGAVAEFPQNVATIDPSIVQDLGTNCTPCGGTTLAPSFSSSVTSGDVLVVAVQYYDGSSISVSSVTDTLSTTFTQQSSPSDYYISSGACSPEYLGTSIWTGTASSSGSDQVTITFSVSNPNAFVTLYEVSGVVATPAATASQSTQVSSSVTSYTTSTSPSYSSNNVLIGSIQTFGDQYPCSHPTISAGSGFTFVSEIIYNYMGTEYETTGSSSTTNFPFTASASYTTDYVEAGVVLSPIILPVQCTMDNSASSVTLTLSGDSASPSTVACDGSSHNITLLSASTLTATEPSDGSTDRQRFSGGGTTISETPCGSGSCTTWSFTNYDERKNSLKFSLQVGTTTSGLTWTYTGYVDSSTSATVCTDSPSSGVTSDTQSPCWSDYNRAITAPAEPSGEAFNERFRNSADGTSTAGTPTTGGNTYTVNYYRQEGETVEYMLDGGGSPTAPTFTYTYLGTSGTTYTMTTSAVTEWLDYGTSWSVSPNPLTGSGTSERWDSTSSLSGTAAAGGTINPSFYNQYSESVAYSVTCDTGATCGAPTLSYYQFGSTTMATLSTTASSYWIDAGSTASVSTSITDNLGNSYTPYISSWLVSAYDVINSPVDYWCGL
ncbi:MAG: hypothetical protein OK442_01885 [Thaumarchaeota archaeon]|nr:hypothetical protein [Nitrososphaerota archaeon]